MKDEQESFITKIVALSGLYQDVKQILILAENINDGQSLYLGPINELRNALDHVMRAFFNYTSNPKDSNLEVSKIKEHLLRAGYDGYEIIATTLINQIQESPIKDFKTEAITNIFPEYYSKYQKELLEVKRGLADIRANKIPEKIIQKIESNDFKLYLTQINRLFEISDTINLKIPAIQNYYQIDNWVGYVDKLNNTYDIDLLTKIIPDYTKLRAEFNKLKKQDISDVSHSRMNEIYHLLSEQEGDLKIQLNKKNKDWWRKEIVIKILASAIVGGLIGYGIKTFFDSRTNQIPSTEIKKDSTSINLK